MFIRRVRCRRYLRSNIIRYEPRANANTKNPRNDKKLLLTIERCVEELWVLRPDPSAYNARYVNCTCISPDTENWNNSFAVREPRKRTKTECRNATYRCTCFYLIPTLIHSIDFNSEFWYCYVGNPVLDEHAKERPQALGVCNYSFTSRKRLAHSTNLLR